MSAIINYYNRVFVWQVPIRIFHWLNALCIVVLSITGYLIGDPPALMSGVDATNQYWFGINRFIHFVAAYIFLVAFIYRIAWMFLGNKYANWRVFFPFSKKSLHDIYHIIKDHIFLQNPKVKDTNKLWIGHNWIGHNPVAAFSYLAVFVFMIVQIITGFALYGDNATWWFPKMFGWVVQLFGGDFNVRFIHHFVMWFFAIFTIIHVYLALWHDWLEGKGEVSSMVAGYKFIRKEQFDLGKSEAGLEVEDIPSDVPVPEDVARKN